MRQHAWQFSHMLQSHFIRRPYTRSDFFLTFVGASAQYGMTVRTYGFFEHASLGLP
jgi:hypothetical protein